MNIKDKIQEFRKYSRLDDVRIEGRERNVPASKMKTPVDPPRRGRAGSTKTAEVDGHQSSYATKRKAWKGIEYWIRDHGVPTMGEASDMDKMRAVAGITERSMFEAPQMAPQPGQKKTVKRVKITKPEREYQSGAGNKSGLPRSPGTGNDSGYEEPELDGEFDEPEGNPNLKEPEKPVHDDPEDAAPEEDEVEDDEEEGEEEEEEEEEVEEDVGCCAACDRGEQCEGGWQESMSVRMRGILGEGIPSYAELKKIAKGHATAWAQAMRKGIKPRPKKVTLRKHSGSAERSWDYGVYAVYDITHKSGGTNEMTITMRVAEGEVSATASLGGAGIIAMQRGATVESVSRKLMSEITTHLSHLAK